LSELNHAGLVQLGKNASRDVAFIHLVTATIAFAAGSVAVLETFPAPPLFELQFIYGTVRLFAKMAIAFGLIGLLLIPVTFRGPRWRQWVFLASVLLASAGFSGGLWVISLVGRAR